MFLLNNRQHPGASGQIHPLEIATRVGDLTVDISIPVVSMVPFSLSLRMLIKRCRCTTLLRPHRRPGPAYNHLACEANTTSVQCFPCWFGCSSLLKRTYGNINYQSLPLALLLPPRHICSHLDVLLVSQKSSNISPQGCPFPLFPASLAVALSSLLHSRTSPRSPSITRIEAHSPGLPHHQPPPHSPNVSTFAKINRIGSGVDCCLGSPVVPFTERSFPPERCALACHFFVHGLSRF